MSYQLDLEKLGITVNNSDGTIKSAEQILQELADIWNKVGLINAQPTEEIRLGIERCKEE